jgi:hypothetical protein
VTANDDRALEAFIGSWLARHGLQAAPLGGGHRPGGGGDFAEADDPVASAHLAERDVAPAAGYANPAQGPGSSLAYPIPVGPDPWVDPLPHLSLGPLDIDTGRHSVRVLGAEVHLTPTEFRLLCYLVEHSDRVVGHRELLLSVWGPGYGDDVHLLQETIRGLRARAANVKDCPLIESVYGTGYRMAAWPEPGFPLGPMAEATTRRG